MNRTTWILAGVAAIAFLAFVLVEGGEEGASTGGGSGILGLFRGGDRAGSEFGAGGSGPGEIAPGEEARKGATAARKGLLKKRLKPGGPPDPALLERMQSGGGNLVATGPAEAPRGGIVRQSFRGARRGVSGGNGTQIAGGAGATDETDSGEDANPDPNDCGAPKVEKTLVDLQARPEMRAAFDVPSRSFLISSGMGERFNIGEAPAFVILIPQTKRASAGAIFDGRFLVLISGRCIPDRAFVKALLRQ